MLFRPACVATAAILAWSTAPAGAAPKPSPTARVVAQSPTVEVLRGGTVRVTLKGIERNNNLLRYEILRQPRHGALSALEQPDPNRQGPGFIVYSHGDDETSLTDTFTYRVTAPISGQSSTGTVTVRILDLPPRLGAPPLLEFASVVGESAQGTLSLTNLGGGTLRGEVRMRPPFHVEGQGAFALGRGRATRIPLRFVPLRPGLTAPERIQPSPLDDPSVSVSLVGEASPAFAVKTSSEELALKSDDTRMVSLELVNLSTNPQEVTVTLEPPGLADAPSILLLPPAGTREVSLRIPPDRRGPAAELRATFSTAVHTESRKFSVPPVPARLVLLTPAIDFGESREMRLSVENAGGVEGRFTLALPEGMTTVEGAASFAVPAGTRTNVTLLVKDRSVPADHLVFDAGSGDEVRVPVTFTSPEPPATPVPTPPPPPPPPRWLLGTDVQLVETAPGQTALMFEREKDSWTTPRLESRPEGSVEWSPFQPTPPPEPAKGLLDELLEAISAVFATLVDRGSGVTDPHPAPSPDDSGSIVILPLGDGDAVVGTLWRLTAEAPDGSRRRVPVSEAFRIDANAVTLTPAELPAEPEPAPEEAPGPPEAPVVFSAVEEIGQQATRTTARIQITLPADPDVTGHRLERLAIVMAINPATKMPSLPVVEPVAHDGEVEIVSVEPMRRDGRDFTIVTASITGLPPGMDTVWRLVPVARDTERPPTKEFFIRTLPAWRFPWSAFWLSSAFAFVCVALFLRWKSRQVPR